MTTDLSGLIYANNIFVAIGRGILTSPDGITWDNRTPDITNLNYLNAVTYGNGLFVMVDKDGIILTSPDGTSWDNRTSGTSNILYGVTYSQ